MILKKNWLIPDSVIGETINEESVILNLELGVYFATRNTGSIIWTLLEQKIASTEIAKHFEATENMENDISSFLKKLSDEQLIIENSNETVAISVETFHKFEIPILEKYTDMKDLLELDPIHEVYHK